MTYLMSMSRKSSSMTFMLHKQDYDNVTYCNINLMRAVRLPSIESLYAEMAWVWPPSVKREKIERQITSKYNEEGCLVKVDVADVCTRCFK